jgi:hypothetical protein
MLLVEFIVALFSVGFLSKVVVEVWHWKLTANR